MARQCYWMKPKFSIIIPVYNVAPYLRECLDSVLAQTFTDWEAICVDDGSTDGSGAILDEYSDKDGRFKVIHQKNAGVSAARNTALEAAVGEWITFLDADDRIDTERLSSLSIIANKHEDVDWIHETKYAARSTSYSVETASELIANDVFLAGWGMLKQNALLVLNTFRRNSIANVKFPEGVRYAEDDIFELRCLPQCKTVAMVGYCGYWYRIDRADAASRRIDVEDSVKIHRLLLETVETQKSYIDSLRPRELFVELFTQTVRKDFGRVFRKFMRAPSRIQKEHRAISRKILHSPCFSIRYGGPCRIGYWVYLETGWLLPMLIQDLWTRAWSKIWRCILARRSLGEQK